MHDPNTRRGFLRGLASLPLIGGSVTFIGQPTAVAVPVTPALLDSYDAWLHFERRYLRWHRYGPEGFRRIGNAVFPDNPGGYFHDDPARTDAASRAAVVLSAVGCEVTSVQDGVIDWVVMCCLGLGSGGFQGKRRLAAIVVGAEAGHGLERHVAVLELPLVVLLDQDRSDEAQDDGLVREDADHVSAPLDLFVEPFERVGRL